jgi:hypothetical protein
LLLLRQSKSKVVGGVGATRDKKDDSKGITRMLVYNFIARAEARVDEEEDLI